MCKDTLENKARLFMDTIIGRAGLHCGRDSVSVSNSRLKKALKLIVYFSEIFPKRYWSHFQDELNNQIEISSSKKSKKQKPNATSDELSWSSDYITVAEEQLEIMFQYHYEEKFIDLFFEENNSVLEKEMFVGQILNQSEDGQQYSWIFNPRRNRVNFQEFFDYNDDQENRFAQYGN